ncbi:hypothetical protein BDQ17DRAFT_915722 [Cyathus striatus]|nr:hypothetical protein BDQ17DRAFT_915722 [Cyathus striatus]
MHYESGDIDECQVLRENDRNNQIEGLRLDRGIMEALEQDILFERRAIEITLVDHAEMPLRLSNFGGLLHRRFKYTGALQDLDGAIDIQKRAVALTPGSHPNYPAMLSNLGSSLLARYQYTGNMVDLGEYIQISKSYADLEPIHKNEKNPTDSSVYDTPSPPSGTAHRDDHYESEFEDDTADEDFERYTEPGDGFNTINQMKTKRLNQDARTDFFEIPGSFGGAHDFVISDSSFVDNSDNSVQTQINAGNGYMLAIGGVFGSVLNADWGSLSLKSSASSQAVSIQVNVEGANARTYTINMPISPETQTKVQVSLSQDGDISQSLTVFAEMRKIAEPVESRTFAMGCKAGDQTYFDHSTGTGMQSWSLALYSRKFKNITSIKSLALWGIISSTTIIHYSRYHF